MKLRNQLLALACLAAFAAAGWLYVRMWVVQKPYGIILFISDGLVARQLTMARLYEGGADHRLALDGFPHLALLRNEAHDFAVPDDAAMTTALLTGTRTNHRCLGVDTHGHPLPTIAELAARSGRALGLVTNCALTDPTPAGFYAHAADGRERESLATQLAGAFRPQVVLGGGARDLLPLAAGGRRHDGRDLLAELGRQGVAIVRSKAELEDAGPSLGQGLLGVFSEEALAYSSQIESGSQQPSLADMVRRAITILQQSRGGYVLLVDAGLVSTAAQHNEGERTITETLALDRAVSTAVRYAGAKSLVLAVGRHSSGGLSLNGYPQRQDRGVALLGTSPEGYPSLTWASGPNGAGHKAEPAAVATQSALNTAEDVLALGHGPGAEKLQGIQPATRIFEILREAL